MSPKQWLALLAFYTMYLFFGASIFYHIEHGYETDRRLVKLQERIEINELLTKHTSPDDENIQKDVLSKVSTYCGKPVTNHTLDEFVDPYVWSFYHSVFFAFTVCSTLGYGNIAPTQTFGRYFMIVYALVGIPVNGILYAYLGDYFAETFTGAYDRYKAYKMSYNQNYVPHHLGMIAQILLYLVPAAVVLIFLPSVLFTYFEGWPYSVSVYYSFVTLSTIGFGDFIPTFQPHQERVFGVYFQLYQAFIILWFVFGLSYLLMLIGFIARGMRHKRITRLEHQLSENIKLTQQRIWTGVTRDVSYLRRIFNEIYMMKFKPVYTDEDDGYVYNVLTRSESCPNLEMYHPRWSTVVSRKRAFSEHYVPPTDEIVTPSKRSGANTNAVSTGDVLARVVQALGTIGAHNEPGYDVRTHGYTDSPHLMDENLSGRLSGSDCQTPPAKPRHRAVSDYRAPDKALIDDPHEWTWNGTNAQIDELRSMRAKINNHQSDLFRQAVSPKLNGSRSHAINIDDNCSSPHAATPVAVKKSFLSQLNPFKMGPYSRKNSIMDFEPPPDARKYLDATNHGRESKMSLRQQYMNASSRGRPSIFTVNDSPDQELLENTTIADLIRALEVAHIQENTPGTLLFDENSRQQSPSHNKPFRMHLSEHTGSRRASMFPADYSEFHELSTSAQLPQIKLTHGGSRRPSAFPVDEARRPSVHPVTDTHADGHLLRLNKPPQGGRRASMFPADFNEFQKFTENILHDSHIRGPIMPTLTIDSPNQSRRVSLLPSASEIHDYQLQSSSRRPSATASGGAFVMSIDKPDHQVKSSSRRPSMIPIGGAFALSLDKPDHPVKSSSRRPSMIPIGGAFALSLDKHDHQPKSSSRRPSAIPIGGAFAVPLDKHDTHGSRRPSIAPFGGNGFTGNLSGAKQSAADRLLKQLMTPPMESPPFEQRRLSNRMCKPDAGLGVPAAMQRRSSLRPSPLVGGLQTDPNSPFLRARRGSQQVGPASTGSARNVIFRPSNLPTLASKNVSDNEKDT